MYVFVVDKNLKPLDPCHPARARELLKKGRAGVFRRYPFTIVLKDRIALESVIHPYRLKIDPGSKTTGLAVVQEKTGRVTFAAHLTHRGQQIRDALLSRAALRRGRRSRHTRYQRPPLHEWSRKGKRFKAKIGREARMPVPKHRRVGWLPPSLVSRVENILTWVNRLKRLTPIAALSQELVKFDTQALVDPEVSGIEYQQGELFVISY